ncbi:UNVERIFIED_CONTAM: hypothetical protein FKN15_056759 [Acipenser sinensis]
MAQQPPPPSKFKKFMSTFWGQSGGFLWSPSSNSGHGILATLASSMQTASPGGGVQTSPGEEEPAAPDPQTAAVPDPQASPGGDLEASPGGDLEASPGGDLEASPGGVMQASPGGDLVASPGGVIQASPGGDLEASPGGGLEASPGENGRPRSGWGRVPNEILEYLTAFESSLDSMDEIIKTMMSVSRGELLNKPPKSKLAVPAQDQGQQRAKGGGHGGMSPFHPNSRNVPVDRAQAGFSGQGNFGGWSPDRPSFFMAGSSPPWGSGHLFSCSEIAAGGAGLLTSPPSSWGSSHSISCCMAALVATPGEAGPLGGDGSSCGPSGGDGSSSGPSGGELGRGAPGHG